MPALAGKLQQETGIAVTQERIPDAGHSFDPGMEKKIGHSDKYMRRRLTENIR